MRTAWTVAAALLLAACSSQNIEPDDFTPAVPEIVYQPSIHAIVAMSGGFGPQGSAQPAVTFWRLEGVDQVVEVPLSPDTVTVQTIVAGRYQLERVTVKGRELLITDSEGSEDSPLSAMALEPGEVIYAGEIFFVEGVAGGGGSEAGNLVVRIGHNPKRARKAVFATHSDQAKHMKTRLVTKRR